MKHLFVPYNLALLAKEKGFDEPCFGIWMERGIKHDVIYVAKQDDAWMAQQNDGILAPLYQQIIDFLNKIGKEQHLDIYLTYDGLNNHLLDKDIEEAFKLI